MTSLPADAISWHCVFHWVNITPSLRVWKVFGGGSIGRSQTQTHIRVSLHSQPPWSKLEAPNHKLQGNITSLITRTRRCGETQEWPKCRTTITTHLCGMIPTGFTETQTNTDEEAKGNTTSLIKIHWERRQHYTVPVCVKGLWRRDNR